MSHVSHQELEFDFWEFVCCSRCQLPFNSNAGQSIPFWLTECGHVICNNHLCADQSCSKCGAQGIQLIPLQRDLDAPMSDWFRSIPYGLDGLAQAAKFQQETLSSQIRYYRARYQQQRVQLDRYKRDHEELMKSNQSLADENAQLRQQLGYDMNDGGMEPSNSVNANGKRPMAAVDPSLRYNEGMYANSTSSPRSAMTPNGPARLTLPRGQQPPTLTRQEHAGDDGTTQSNRRQGFQDQRPRSSHPLAEQYAYQPPPTANRARPVATMAYSQTAPRMLQSNAQDDGNQQGSSSATMPPPGRFNPQPRSSKPAPQGASAQSRNRTHTGGPPRTSHASNAAPMAPPFARAPPPSARAPPSSARPLPPGSARRPQNTPAPNSNRFMPPPPPGIVQRLGPGATPSANRRFVPPTPSRGRFVPEGVPGSARQPQRTMQGNGGGGGQRMPFVPGGG
ncbi:hypothetical protein K523DRAFT_385282 [Schizophyllum commune Tattone D]|nr:hypothetical protein K523DRAFT_385282 [Schizophyllum commune Tattone D]